MKVGILTFYAANNYGTCLQAYALQKSIEKMGQKCEIIRLRGEKLSVPPVASRSLTARMTDFVVKTGAKVVKTAAQPAFERFRNQYYHYSDWVDQGQLASLNDRYDLFLSGSDQVWNYNIAGNLDVYLQTFVRDARKKGSYAASFGLKELPKELEQQYAQALSEFHYLGIREPEGAALVEKLTGRRAQVVVDPTQLLEPEDWEEIMRPIGSDKPYIMVYQLGFSKTLLQCAGALRTRDLVFRAVSGGGVPQRGIPSDDLPRAVALSDAECQLCGDKQLSWHRLFHRISQKLLYRGFPEPLRIGIENYQSSGTVSSGGQTDWGTAGGMVGAD